jgi:hypothetical protein
MDTSANELLQALNPAGAKPALGKGLPVDPGRQAPGDTQLGRPRGFRAGRFVAVSGWPCAAVRNAILIALSLWLAGCGDLQPVTKTRLIPPPPTDIKGAQGLTSTRTQLEAPATPAPPPPQPVVRASETKPPPAPISETKPSPATASKGAEKLAAPNVPVPVRANERTTPPPKPSVPKAPAAEVSVTATDAPVQALIFKGPPPQARTSRALKVLLWLGLGLGGAALAVLARVWAVRRITPADLREIGKEEFKAPPGLLFKEPLNLPPETATAEKP